MSRTGELAGHRWQVAVVAAGAALLAGAGLVVVIGLLVSVGTASPASHSTSATGTGSKTPHTSAGSAQSGDAIRVTIPPAPVPTLQNTVPATPTGSASAPTPTTAVRTVPSTPSVAPPPTSQPSPRPAPSLRPAVSPGAVPSVVVQAPPGAAGVAAALIVAVNRQSGGRESIPVTPENVVLIDRWMANEGGLWADNPLNTSHSASGRPHQYTAGGQDTGIPIFSSMSVGVEANAATLLGNPRYARILRVLSSGSASCITFADAVIRSPWASGHYDHDPSGFCSGRITPRRRTGPGRHAHTSNLRSRAGRHR